MVVHTKMLQTTMLLDHHNRKITIPDVKIWRGNFEKDSLSPLLFCLAIDHRNKLLNKSQFAYNLSQGRQQELNKKVNPLIFMSDRKLHAILDVDLSTLLQSVHTFSKDIGMKFGLEKYISAHSVVERRFK